MGETAERPARPWWRRSEFWSTLGGGAAAVGASVVGVLPAAVGATLGVVAAVSYTISRGLAKFGTGR